jgi:hypothetical protein
MAGLQCHKRLYLECFHSELADPVDDQQQAIFDAGTRVGQLARDMWPGGVLVTEDHLHHREAIESAMRVLSDTAVSFVFEGAFLYDDIRIRADIFSRVGEDLYGLIEVKSTTSVKKEHVFDAAIQLHVLDGCGFKVRRASIAYLNREYIYQGGNYDIGRLFRVEDILDQVERVHSEVLAALEEMRWPLWDPEPPDIKPGTQCSHPYTCSFFGHCHTGESENPVTQLPRATQKLLLSLGQAGIEDIRNIPTGFPGLSTLQRRVRECVVQDHFHLGKDLPRILRQLSYPIHFLDFETFNPALPLFPGTRPYQIIPFQWSDHILEREGQLRHEEFLHGGSGDPREPFARNQLDTLAGSGTIVVYSSFEESRIRGLATALPDLASDLLGLLDGRIVDMLKLIRTHCYHPEFHGSFSIKSVLPALVPGFGYSDLQIHDGDMASVAYAEMTQSQTSTRRRDQLCNCLLEYCRRDTEAMVRIYEVLR